MIEIPLLVDTREQQREGSQYTFASCERAGCKVSVERVTLKTGDYSVGLPAEVVETFKTNEAASIVIERKTLADLYGSFTARRENLLEEFERMMEYNRRYLLIEASLFMVGNPNRYLAKETKCHPNSIIGSIDAWSLRCSVGVIYAESRAWAEKYAFNMLTRYYLDIIDPDKAAYYMR